jgi:hypothetical protein
MNATKAVARNGNHKITLTAEGVTEGEAIENISEASMVAGGHVYEWCFTAKYVYQVHYTVDNTKNQASLNI